ncbi:transcription antitermination factor NusB [Nisaea acidiphila]|uniref:Transcription antitermination protein NusB n=1 Tax=Nisaea acidiphila TaxID=1862145 RepID=A0A9J7ARJ3_9PROT|nr:transcription antitermination factor NusB [Nisaea acidiphila]UUX50227.1 transcription antitermination factor NusB [Nisaea acidiphila]
MSKSSEKAADRKRRTAARLAAVQTLYQMAITGTPAPRVISEFKELRLDGGAEDESFGPADPVFYERLAAGVASDLETVDRLIEGALTEDWSLDRLETIVRNILQSGAHELLSHGDVPAAVVISEYVDVAHAFFAEKEPGFINGVLDRIARTVRDDRSGAVDSGAEDA